MSFKQAVYNAHINGFITNHFLIKQIKIEKLTLVFEDKIKRYTR